MASDVLMVAVAGVVLVVLAGVVSAPFGPDAGAGAGLTGGLIQLAIGVSIVTILLGGVFRLVRN